MSDPNFPSVFCPVCVSSRLGEQHPKKKKCISDVLLFWEKWMNDQQPLNVMHRGNLFMAI